MDADQTWQVIETERRSLADLLEDLPGADWDAPSLCAGWRVRDVAAHVAMSPQPPGPAMPLEAARTGADRVWEMGWPFWTRRRLRGYRLTATDVDWSVGAGADIRGPIDALLLLLVGRGVALACLDGDGVAQLSERDLSAR